MDSLYTPFTTGQVLLHVTICLYLLCRINKSVDSCDSSPDYHVMCSPGGIYTSGFHLVLSLILLLFPHLPLPHLHLPLSSALLCSGLIKARLS